MKYDVSIMRTHQSLIGMVILEFFGTDVHITYVSSQSLYRYGIYNNIQC